MKTTRTTREEKRKAKRREKTGKRTFYGMNLKKSIKMEQFCFVFFVKKRFGFLELFTY